MNTTAPSSATLPNVHDGGTHPKQGTFRLALGAIGIVYGDIGTSPLYSLQVSFSGHHKLAVDPLHVFGVMSLVFWTLTLVVTVKYVLIILRADNRGEGGSLSLLALISRLTPGSGRGRYLTLLGVLATALFFGDCIITPAVSVLSAVEGLSVVNDHMAPLVLPISIAILIGLFLIQARGTAKIGALFAPVMVVYFIVISIMGVSQLIQRPDILGAINPIWGFAFSPMIH